MCNGLVKAVEIDPLEFARDALAIACLENIPGTQVRAGLTGFKILIYFYIIPYQGLAYLLFLTWLCNTVLVFRDTVMTSDEVNAASSLIWAQELSQKTPETKTSETTA